MVQLLPVEPLRFRQRLVFLQRTTFEASTSQTVAERQDACLELQKNFNGQELSYIRNSGRGSGAKGLHSVQLEDAPPSPHLMRDTLARGLAGEIRHPRDVVSQLVTNHIPGVPPRHP
jgi:hypothetical protein